MQAVQGSQCDGSGCHHTVHQESVSADSWTTEAQLQEGLCGCGCITLAAGWRGRWLWRPYITSGV